MYFRSSMSQTITTGKIKLHVALAAMVFILSIAGCQGLSNDQELSLAGSRPSSLDPAHCMDATSASYIVEVFSGLVTLNDELEVMPDIAASWEISPDGTIYTFHLRDKVSFHDGKEVTADDIKYSIERAADPETHSQVAEAYLGDIVGFKEKLNAEADEVSGVHALDDRTLEITIDAPKAYFLAKLVHPTSFVVDRDNVASGEDWWKHPNGTGPFRLAEWEAGERIVLERNEHFYRGVANLKRITFLLQGSSMMMYENDEIDITGVGTYNIDRVLDPKNPLNDELVIASELSVYYIGFNTEMPPFDDAAVRQAFCYAVDKDKLIEFFAKGIVSPAYGILPPGMPGYNEGLEGLSYNLTTAQQLIADSDYADSLPPIVLSVPSSAGGVSAIDSAIAWMWQEDLGVNVTIQAVDWDTAIEDLNARELQAFAIGWIADYPDPENFLDLLFHSRSVENHTAYSNPEVDELLETARVESDSDIRMEMYQAIEQTIVDDAPWLPLYFGQSYYLVKPEVKGFSASPMVIPMLKDIWIEE